MRISLLLAIALTLSGLCVAQDPWTFVSIPDFQNNDIGSLADPDSSFPNNPSLPPGFLALDANWDSCTADYDDSVDWIVGQLASEDPVFVTVAGDLVMGHWDRSSDGRLVFGPLGSDPQVEAALWSAADYYYDIWLGRFDPQRNTHLTAALQALGRPLVPLDVHAVVGDHELGDNNWSAGGLRSRMVPTYKEAFARWHTRVPAGATSGQPRYAQRPVGTVYEDTAYAFQQENLLMVVVDEFRQDDPATALGPNGSVLPTVDDGLPGAADDQLSWLDQVLAAGRADPTVDWIVVQGHMPVLRPVRVRNSSNLGLRDADGTTEFNTQFWQTLSQHEVDAYFCGEVHDITLSRYGGVTQVVHGALIGNHSPINYLRVDVFEDRLEMTSMQIPVELTSGSLWQTGSNRPRANFDIPPATRVQGFQAVGYATLTRSLGGGSIVTQANGTLAPFGTFDNGDGLAEYLVDIDFDQLTGGVYDNAATLSNDGVPEGNVTQVPGALGLGITLDGVQDRVVAGPSPIGGNAARTVSVWAKTSSTSGLRSVLTMGNNGLGSKWDLDIDCNNAGVIELGVGGGRTTGQGPALNDGQWHMLTTVLPDGATTLGGVRLFVDGAFAYTNSGTRAINTGGGDLIVGHSANQAWFQAFDGEVDDLVIWREPLTDAQVKSLHDVAVETALAYAATEFEQLLTVYRQDASEVTIGGRVWRRATGLGGPAGLTSLSGGRYELVFEPAGGLGVRVVYPNRVENFGTGCAGTGGVVPSISATGVPVLGTSPFALHLTDCLANAPVAMLLSVTRGDLPIGGGCTLYPGLPTVSVALSADANGAATLPIAMSTDPTLLGVELYWQWAIADVGGAFGPGLAAFSGGLEIVLGDV